MEAFDFNEAIVNPWVDIAEDQGSFFVIVVRTKRGEAMTSLVKTNEDEMAAVISVLHGASIAFIRDIYDISAIELDAMFEIDANAATETILSI